MQGSNQGLSSVVRCMQGTNALSLCYSSGPLLPFFLALSSTQWGGSPGHPTRWCLSGGGPQCTPSFSLEYGGGLAWGGGETSCIPAVGDSLNPSPPLPGKVVLKSLSTTWLLPKCMASPPPVLSGVGAPSWETAKKEPGSEVCQEGSSLSAVAHPGGCPGPPTTTWFQALPMSHWFLEHSFTLAGKSRPWLPKSALPEQLGGRDGVVMDSLSPYIQPQLPQSNPPSWRTSSPEPQEVETVSIFLQTVCSGLKPPPQ